jgi:hypothetical protein
MRALMKFLHYALSAIGWAVVHKDMGLVATDLHGTRWRITVTHES